MHSFHSIDILELVNVYINWFVLGTNILYHRPGWAATKHSFCKALGYRVCIRQKRALGLKPPAHWPCLLALRAPEQPAGATTALKPHRGNCLDSPLPFFTPGPASFCCCCKILCFPNLGISSLAACLLFILLPSCINIVNAIEWMRVRIQLILHPLSYFEWMITSFLSLLWALAECGSQSPHSSRVPSCCCSFASHL